MELIDSAGSVYALAKRAGTAPNTIRRYLTNSEPTRPMLIAVAKAGEVSQEWLATGRPPRAPSDGQSPTPAQSTPEAEGFRERLKFLASQKGGIRDFCNRIEMPESDLAMILEGRPITIAELAKLGAHPSVPIRWLLSGDGDSKRAHDLDAHFLESLAAQFVAIDDKRTYLAKHEMPPVIRFDHARAGWKETVFKVVVLLYEWLPPAKYQIHQVDYSTMRPVLDVDDIAVVNRDEDSVGTGYYLFNSGDDGLGKSTPDFVAKAIRVGGKIQIKHSDHAFSKDALHLEDTKVTCLGRVAVIMKRSLR